MIDWIKDMVRTLGMKEKPAFLATEYHPELEDWYDKKGDVPNGVKEVIPDGVGEPVISFVNCVLANPKRFKIERRTGLRILGRSYYTLKDTKTNEGWPFYQHTVPYQVLCAISIISNLHVVSDLVVKSEVKYILDKLEPLFHKYQKRLANFNEKKHNRDIRRERKRLMGVYCK